MDRLRYRRRIVDACFFPAAVPGVGRAATVDFLKKCKIVFKRCGDFGSNGNHVFWGAINPSLERRIQGSEQMIATVEGIADPLHGVRAAAANRPQPRRRAAWSCKFRLCLTLSLTCLFAVTMVGTVVGCAQMLAFSSFTPLEIVHGLTASK